MGPERKTAVSHTVLAAAPLRLGATQASPSERLLLTRSHGTRAGACAVSEGIIDVENLRVLSVPSGGG